MRSLRTDAVEQLMEQAWQNVAHHVDAYAGYPAVQDDIVNEEAERLFIEQHAHHIPGATPVILHAASRGPEAIRAQNVAEHATDRPDSHLGAMLGAFDDLLGKDMPAAQLAVNALREQFVEDSLQRRVLERRWAETIDRVSRRLGGQTLVNQLKIS